MQKKNWYVGVVAGGVSACLIFLLIQKHQELGRIQETTKAYKEIRAVLDVPDDFSERDDTMRGVVNEESLDILDSLPMYTTFNDDAVLMRSNILLLDKKFNEALEVLGTPTTAEGRYNGGTIALLGSYDALISATSGSGNIQNLLEESRDRIQASDEAYELAGGLVDKKTALSKKILHNHVVVGELKLFIALHITVNQLDELFTDISVIKKDSGFVRKRLLDIVSIGETGVFENETSLVCLERLADERNVYEVWLEDMLPTLDEYRSLIKKTYIYCIDDPIDCIENPPAIHDEAKEVFLGLRTLIGGLVDTYTYVYEALEDANEEIFIAWCIARGEKTKDTELLLHDLTRQLKEQKREEEKDQMSVGSGDDSVDSLEPLPIRQQDPQRSSYLLEDIKKAQHLWLEKKKTLESASDYLPQDLLDEMFHRFDGDDSSFDDK